MSDEMRQIALRIADLREISGYSVAEMAEACQLPLEAYQAYESGEVDIPISFLLKINEIFHVDPTELLTGKSPKLSQFSVTRAGKGQVIRRANHYRYKNLAYNFAKRKVEPLYVTVPVDANRNLTTNSHDGHEFDYILKGTMRIVVGDHEVILQPGDSIYYDSTLPHAMQAYGEEPVEFLAIVIP
ncbi:MAG: helix-turn-helix transcriptional regulator [Clostridiales bacterium]|nr:helix-turn-helix transcriptional regulator [Clostridiales bacterium]